MKAYICVMNSFIPHHTRITVLGKKKYIKIKTHNIQLDNFNRLFNLNFFYRFVQIVASHARK